MHYIGSKRSLLNFIEETVNKYHPNKDGVFCDLFAGTGSVGIHFKKLGYDIISNDLEFYSYTILKHYIENSKPINITSLLEELNLLTGIDSGFVFNHYCPLGSNSSFTKDDTTIHRMYFTDENGKKIDDIRETIERWKKTKKINNSTYFYLLSCLIKAADKVANTTGVYGAFLKKFKSGSTNPIILTDVGCILSQNTCKAYNQDAKELIKKISGDILYLDPPYNNRQYGANYHLLNTIAKADSPTIRGLTGLRDYNVSNWCKKSEVEQELHDLLKNAKFKIVLMSYNNDGILSVEDIKSIMSQYGTYYVEKQSYKRYKSDSNRNYNDNDLFEYIHILIPHK